MADLVPVIDQMSRAVILRERYIRRTYNQIIKLLLESEARLIHRIEQRLEGLSGADLARFQRDDWTTKRLIAVRESIQDLANKYRQVMNSEIRLSSRELISAEVELAMSLANTAQAGAGMAISLGASVSEYQTYVAAMSQPFNGQVMKSYMKGVEQGVRRRVLQSLRISFANGETVPEAVKAIRGTRSKGYRDGIMDISRRAAQTTVRTTMTHMAARSQEAVYADLGIDKAMFVATLDSRTTYGCAALDQTVWPLTGKRPSIPRHLNCRSAWAPYLEEYPLEGERTARPEEKTEYVSASTNFDKWLGNQSTEFQREWLGATRYRLWKQGKPLGKFIDPQFKEYTVAQLKEQYALK